MKKNKVRGALLIWDFGKIDSRSTCAYKILLHEVCDFLDNSKGVFGDWKGPLEYDCGTATLLTISLFHFKKSGNEYLFTVKVLGKQNGFCL